MKDGVSPSLNFSAELTNFLSDQLPGVNQIAPLGSIEGRLQWVEYGHQQSRMKLDGTYKDEFKAKL